MMFQPISFLMATIAVLLLVVLYQGITHMIERRRLVKANDDLMNRLMSRDFTSYAAGQVAMSTPANRKTLAEYFNARKSKLDEKEERDDGLGMPIT